MIDLTEEAVLNDNYLYPYMKDWRRFRIEYSDPETGFSNIEGLIYLPNDPKIIEEFEEWLYQMQLKHTPNPWIRHVWPEKDNEPADTAACVSCAGEHAASTSAGAASDSTP